MKGAGDGVPYMVILRGLSTMVVAVPRVADGGGASGTGGTGVGGSEEGSKTQNVVESPRDFMMGKGAGPLERDCSETREYSCAV